ncbi:MAG: hypothetical protein ACKVQA_03925 [Burkholderiales bacterium]
MITRDRLLPLELKVDQDKVTYRAVEAWVRAYREQVGVRGQAACLPDRSGKRPGGCVATADPRAAGEHLAKMLLQPLAKDLE